MKKFVLVVLLGLGLLTLGLTPVLAQPDISVGLDTIQTQTQYGKTDLVKTIGRIIEIVLGFLGLIALILFIVGGFKWMTSGGNEENISGAKKLMSAAVVGLFIILIAYAATLFIIGKLKETTAEECTDGQTLCVFAGNPASPARYKTCSDKNWSTTETSCQLTGVKCTTGNVYPSAAAVCLGQ